MIFDKEYLKKGIFKVISVHIISILISFFLTLCLPKFIMPYDFGLWQLYLLYISYLGFFHLGWIDGIYLKNVGKTYENIDKKELGSELKPFIIIQFIFSLIFYIYAISISDVDKKVLFVYLGIVLVFENTRNYFIQILQATGRINEFCNTQLIERISLVAILFILLTKFRSYHILIISDVAARFITLVYSSFKCKDMLNNVLNTSINIKEIINNISVGINLMFGNIFSMLTTGVTRFSIENRFGVVTFGIVSLAITFSSFCITTFNSMGLVFIPLLKNKNNNDSVNIYNNTHYMIDSVLFFSMIFYYPVYLIMIKVLPKYSLSFEYLAITFPIIYFGCLQSILHNTYLKSLRKERNLFISNVLTTIFAIVLMLVGRFFIDSLIFLIYSLILIYIFKNTIFEFVILNALNNKAGYQYIYQSIIFTFCFIICNFYIKSFTGFVIYVMIFIIWCVINFKKILNGFGLIFKKE